MFIDLKYYLIYQLNHLSKIQEAFLDLHEIFLENLFSPSTEMDVKETIYLLFLFAIKFNMESIPYEAFSSIVFLYSRLPIIDKECEDIWKIFVQILNQEDQKSLLIQLQNDNKTEKHSSSLKLLVQSRIQYFINSDVFIFN
jgi:hypothetical protein